MSKYVKSTRNILRGPLSKMLGKKKKKIYFAVIFKFKIFLFFKLLKIVLEHKKIPVK